jgi:hypothetical protein
MHLDVQHLEVKLERGNPMTTEDSRAAMHRYRVIGSGPHLCHHHGHHGWSRRQFLQASGLFLGGVAADFPWGSGTAIAAKPESGLPKQIHGFSPLLKEEFNLEIPFFLAPEVDPFTNGVDSVETPTTIWDFNGTLGLIEADGVSDADQNSDGVARHWGCDVRFMTGVFRDRTGRIQQGTFCFL